MGDVHHHRKAYNGDYTPDYHVISSMRENYPLLLPSSICTFNNYSFQPACQSVRLHAQLGRATVKALLGHFIGLIGL